MPQKTLIVIVGPTAIGKTTLAILLAQYYHTEIISADSRQFFKEMNIGTAKPTDAELFAAKHHFINSHEVNSLFSTGDFEAEALGLIDTLFKTNDVLIMVGGSGLYIDAICNGLDELPETSLVIREKLNKAFEKGGLEAIRTQLEAVDPEYYAKVDQSNPQRMIRGLEMFLSTGKKLSSLLTNRKKKRPFHVVKIGLNTDRAVVYERINQRVDDMMNAGLLEEVRSLVPFRHQNALKTVGYSELFDYLDGKIDLPSAISMIKQNTRRFAKRQLTWFKRDEDTVWFEPNQKDEILTYLENVLILNRTS